MADGYYNEKGEWVPSVKGRKADESGAEAVAANQEKARKAITAKDQIAPGRPSPPDTRGMSLAAAAAANTEYRKKLAAWEASKGKTAATQASAIE